MISNAFAQASSLPAVAQSSGIDWFLLLGIAAIVGVVALFAWYKRKNPTGAAALQTAAGADLKAIGADLVAELAKLRTAVEAKLAPAAAPVAAEPAAPAVVAGKNGVTGTFTFTAAVIGDPVVDLPSLIAAVTTQYSAK